LLTSIYFATTSSEHAFCAKEDRFSWELDKIIKNSFELLKKGESLSPQKVGLPNNIDLFTYFTMASHLLMHQFADRFKDPEDEMGWVGFFKKQSEIAHYIAMECYPKNALTYDDVRTFSKLVHNDLVYGLKVRKLNDVSVNEEHNKKLTQLLEKLYSSGPYDKYENYTHTLVRDKYNPYHHLIIAIINYELNGDLENTINSFLRIDKLRPKSLYVYSCIANLFETLSWGLYKDTSRQIKDGMVETGYNNVEEVLWANQPNEIYKSIQIVKDNFPFLQKLSSIKCTDLLVKNYNTLTKTERKKLSELKKNLSETLQEIVQLFYKEIAKETLDKGFFKEKKFCNSKNEVYEIKNPLLRETFIIKKSKKDNTNLKSEKDIIAHYKKNKNLNLADIIDFRLQNNEQYLLLKRKQGVTMLDCLALLKDVKKSIKTTHEKNYRKYLSRALTFLNKEEYTCFNASLFDLKEWFNAYMSLEVDLSDTKLIQFIVDKEIESGNKMFNHIFRIYGKNLSSKDFFLYHIDVVQSILIQSCLKHLAELNSDIPKELIKKEFIKGDYKKEALDVFTSFEPNLNKKFSIDFKTRFLKNYESIDNVLATAPKFLYKDAYLNNWIITTPDYITSLDFERCTIAPVQLDLAFLLDFDQFIEEKEKYYFLDYYIDYFNQINLNKSLIPDKKEFKRVFDYACVHRNLLTFRSYNRFIKEGDNREKTAEYRRVSLNNSIKALQKLISYEKDNISELKSLCNDLENVYHKIYK